MAFEVDRVEGILDLVLRYIYGLGISDVWLLNFAQWLY